MTTEITHPYSFTINGEPHLASKCMGAIIKAVMISYYEDGSKDTSAIATVMMLGTFDGSIVPA